MKILVTVPLTDEERIELQSKMPGADYVFTERYKATEEEIREADIILGNVVPDKLAGASNLKWLQLNTAGADQYVKRGVLPAQTILTNAAGCYELSVSEHMLASTFYLVKKLGLYHRNQMDSLWKDEGQVQGIEGSRTLVVGLGSIGSSYARKMSLLGSRVVGLRRSVSECPEYLEAIGTVDELDRYLPEADIVALSLPHTPQTAHIMNAERLSAMKKGSFLINAGRGGAIDQEALVNALHSGPLAGAALDVTDPEPLPADHPLWKCENLLLTPHVAGGYHMQETLRRIIRLFIDNLGRYAAGEELRAVVRR
jgi:phosphoglycerate dehydrogenase-like enzyme